jgi:PTH2 family peptidyl-tRNA hydrolase
MSDLRMVAVFRGDLEMPIGKLAVQAGHAFLAAFRSAPQELREAYDFGEQAKLALIAPNLNALLEVENKAARRGVPNVLITDLGRTVFSEKTVTVLGLGPMTKTDSNALTRGLEML